MSDLVKVTVTDTTEPTINNPEDIIYTLGETGFDITWEPFDFNPDTYTIKKDGKNVVSDTWDGSDITINVDGLDVGNHTFVCTVYDEDGRSTSDTVMVVVEEQKNQWVAPLLISIGSVGAASAVIVVFWKVIKPRYTIVRRT